VLENVTQWLALSRQLGDLDSEAAALERLTRIHNMRSEYFEAQRSLDQLRSVARDVSFISLPGVMAQLAGQIHMVAGEFNRAEQVLAEALSAEYDDTDSLVLAGPHPRSMALCIGSLCNWILGRVGDACSLTAYADDNASRLGETMSLAVTHTYRAGLARELGHVDQAREAIEAFRSESESTGLVLDSSFLHAVEAWLLIESGDSEAAVTFLRERLGTFPLGGVTIYSTSAFVVLAEALLAEDDAEQGLDCIEEALRCADDTGERMYTAELHRLRGELRLRQGDRAAAETSFCRAIEVARAQGARSFELRAAISLARSWGRQGKTEQAIGILEPVLCSIDGGSDTRDVMTAQALLGRLRA
jgi:adenylate cyclase